jgi:eukaryotic-like serine/threonine-protein kinase
VIGKTLAHYRVSAAIGAGGMGEVYRATDTHLRRDVAIKVLPPDVARDEERLGRFRREAHLLASLNHPNIAAIYGLEEADGTPFLALELVEGEDLKQRLARGAIPVDEAVEIAKQIAEALEEAHGKGIVHRDLKPANVKLTPDGKVKVLDFGLAKAWGGAADSSPSAALSLSPTVAPSGTMAGVVLGTAAYMSPEQARGRAVDRRADVWAFGVLLWEMLTGRTLFVGDTLTDVIAGVVTREPDLDALPADTPAAVRRLVGRCLRKDPRTRLPDIGAARLELQDVLAGGASDAARPAVDATAARGTEGRGRTRERWAWAAVTVLTAIAGALAFVYLRPAAAPAVAVRFAAEAPEGWSFDAFGWPVPSPDGRQIAFVARQDGPEGSTKPAMIWIRSLESLSGRPLAGTDGADQGVPAWSPDGRFLVFFAGGEVRKIHLADGTVQRLCAMPSPGNLGADWNDGDTILFSAGGSAGRIYSVPAAGGEARPLTALDSTRGEQNHHMPQFLPDGRRFVFLIAAGGRPENAGLYLASLDAPSQRQQVAGEWLRYVLTPGHLLYARDGTLFARPFDVEKDRRSGEPVAIASSVGAWSQVSGVGWFGVSPAGTIALFSSSGVSTDVQLAWMDRKGQQTATIGVPGHYRQLTLSPDGRRVALEVRQPGEPEHDLWVMDVERGVASRVTATREDEMDPVWSPDSKTLAFTKGGKLWTKGLRVSDRETVLAALPETMYPENWSPDGRTLLFVRAGTPLSVWALPLDGNGEPEPLFNTGFDEDEPQISPDGRWVAYISNESGRFEVYVEPFRREGERVRVSIDGGGQPKWRADGKELFYTTADNRLLAATVRIVADRLVLDPPAVLFTLRSPAAPNTDDYAATADGQRFLVKVPLDTGRNAQLHVLTNWRSLLH